ncbi:MAG: DUF924 domain-containing protein [Polaromonas sp.]|uniref:DUF924 family protein n=1 Tax=Polaromonas sp. TaxID=1869339 RepID=UPI0017B8024A|nr:DUF924 family protein [Polaromonas sp.]MBA3595538.1 DUF924 domain-containing protein [Polaromonas sp.]
MTEPATPAAILEFWLGEDFASGWPASDMGKQWFSGTPELDQQIADRFGALVEQALVGGLTEWEARPLDRLALVILLDQFPRNIYRGQAQAFAGDARAQRLVADALAQGMDTELPWVGRVFLYMPLMHAENLPLQEEGVRRFRKLATEAPEDLRDTLTSSLRFAEQHRDIIARLGRFPYRNNALDRTSSALEYEFLKNGPRFGQ